VTDAGGADGQGTVFELDTTGKETVLYSFTGGADGGRPGSVLIADSEGNLYGTTEGGGKGCGTGCGVVFELSPQGKSWAENVLYTFCSLSNCADGEEPVRGPLVRDAAGNLYGTTYFGGAHHNCNENSCGVVFKLDTAGKETVLHSFTGGADGAEPAAGLIMDNAGNLYGTTELGGDAQCPAAELLSFLPGPPLGKRARLRSSVQADALKVRWRMSATSCGQSITWNLDFRTLDATREIQHSTGRRRLLERSPLGLWSIRSDP